MKSPAERLALAIIEQAITDLWDPTPEVRRRASAFLNSASLDAWCEHLNIAPMEAVITILEEMAPAFQRAGSRLARLH